VAGLVALVLVVGFFTAGGAVQEEPVTVPIQGVPVGVASSPHLPPAADPYWSTGVNGVALSFDDGPDPTWTPRILQVLAKYHIHAVFCMIGYRVREHPELVRAVAAAGHTLCNHTVEHDPTIGNWTARAIRADLAENNELITAASGGVRPVYFRSPRMEFTPRIIAVARSLGLASLGCRVTASDWIDPPRSPRNIKINVHDALHRDSIILLHDGGAPGTHAHTVAVLPLIINDTYKRGWRFTTI
jgi:peptidoglycan/xylan/chitin deacetylase (PgdA/CDA1 family)